MWKPGVGLDDLNWSVPIWNVLRFYDFFLSTLQSFISIFCPDL